MNMLRGYVFGSQSTCILKKRYFQVYCRFFSSGTKTKGQRRINVSQYQPKSDDDYLKAFEIEKAKWRELVTWYHSLGWVPLHVMKEATVVMSKKDHWDIKLARLILQSCGNKLPTCQNHERVCVTNAIWDYLKKACSFSLDELHILLAVDAENCHYRPGVLSDMEVRGLTPTDATYNLLLKSAAESNNKSAFEEIKLTMNTKRIEFNHNIDSLFITLYAFDKNLDEIRYVHDMLRRVKTAQTATTYFALMRAYASLGKFDLLLNCTEEAYERKMPLETHEIAYIVAELVQCGNSGNILPFVKHSGALGLKLTAKDMNWLTAFLTSRHHRKVAYQLLAKSKAVAEERQVLDGVPTLDHDSPPATLAFVMAGYWDRGANPEEMLAALKSIEGTLRYPWSMETALHGALRHQRWDVSWSIIREMHRVGKSLRPQYFWPLLTSAKSTKEIFEVVESMVSLGVEMDTETIKSFVIQKILPLGVDQLLLEGRLKKLRLRNRDLVLPFVIHFLENDRMDLAAKVASRLVLHGDQDIVQPLVSAYLRTLDGTSMIQILSLLVVDKVTTTDWVGEIMLHLHRKDSAAAQKLLSKPKSERFRISPEIVNFLNNSGSRTDIRLLGKAVDLEGKRPRQLGPFTHPNQMNINELENHLNQCRTRKTNVRGTLRKLFIKHTNNRNTARARVLLDELLEYPDSTWSPGMLISQMYFHALLGEAGESLRLYKQISSKFPDIKIDSFKIAALVQSLVKANRKQDALVLLERVPKLGQAQKDMASYIGILDAASQSQDIDTLRKLTFLLIEKNYVAPSNTVFSYLVSYFIQRGEINEAVNEFKFVNSRYGLYPCKFELLVALLTARLKGTPVNVDQLKTEVIAILLRTRVYQPIDELFAAAEAGDAREVSLSSQKTIAEENCLVQDDQWRSIGWQCRRWAVENNKRALELLLSAVLKLKVKIDLSDLFIALADVYHYEGNSAQLKELSMLVSENNVSVTSETVNSIRELERSCSQSGKQLAGDSVDSSSMLLNSIVYSLNKLSL